MGETKYTKVTNTIPVDNLPCDFNDVTWEEDETAGGGGPQHTFVGPENKYKNPAKGRYD